MNREPYNRIEPNKSELHSVKESLLQKVKLLDELNYLQKKFISNLIDTAIANKHLKAALSIAMSLTL